MEVLRLVLRYAHLIGFGLLLGGAVAQYLTGRIRINAAMLWGAVVQVVTGLALAAPIDSVPDSVNQNSAKLVVKAAVALLILIMVYVPRKRDVVSTGHFMGIISLTLVNAAIAVFWH